MQILIHRNGQQSGPFSLEEVRAQLASGTLLPTDLAWHEGAPDWMPVSAIPGVTGGTPPPTPPRNIPPSQYAAARPPEQTSGLAIVSLVLGILGFFSAGLTALPAVICGHIARSKIKHSDGQLSGDGLALSGVITGYVSMVFFVAMLAGIALPVYAAVRTKGMQTRSVMNAKQIATACLSYATDHNGNFPAQLEDLAPTYIPNRSILIDPLDPEHSPDGYE